MFYITIVVLVSVLTDGSFVVTVVDLSRVSLTGVIRPLREVSGHCDKLCWSQS